MRDFKANISVEDGNTIRDFFIEQLEECVQGATQDNYFFTNTKGFKYGNWQTRDYIMLLEHYDNEWSSSYTLIMTDKDKEFWDMLEEYKQDYFEETGVRVGED